MGVVKARAGKKSTTATKKKYTATATATTTTTEHSTHLDILPRFVAVDPILHVKPQVARQLVHEVRARSDDVAVPGRFCLRRYLLPARYFCDRSEGNPRMQAQGDRDRGGEGGRLNGTWILRVNNGSHSSHVVTFLADSTIVRVKCLQCINSCALDKFSWGRQTYIHTSMHPIIHPFLLWAGTDSRLIALIYFFY